MQQTTLTLAIRPIRTMPSCLRPCEGAHSDARFSFPTILQDIQTLNERATRGELDISAVSIHAYAYVSDKYALLPSGCQHGDGYGPMLVAKQKFSRDEVAGKKSPCPEP